MIGDDIRAADVIGMPGCFPDLEAALEVPQHIPNTNGLQADMPYPGQGNQGQAIGSIAKDLKRCASRSQYHGCPENGNRHTAALENLAHSHP